MKYKKENMTLVDRVANVAEVARFASSSEDFGTRLGITPSKRSLYILIGKDMSVGTWKNLT